MDRTILTSKDMRMIIAGLRSLDSVSGSKYYSQLMEKIQAGSAGVLSGSESMLIDLLSWHKDSLPTKIEIIQKAIEERILIRFQYYSPGGEGIREVEPYFLIFKWSSWYVWGFCRNREDFRMFKLTRMDELVKTRKYQKNREVPIPDLSDEAIFPGKVKVKALFDPSMKWHLIEEFGTDTFRKQPNGKLLLEHEYTDKDNLITWILTCKDKVEILEPQDIRSELLYIITNIKEKYEKEDFSCLDQETRRI